MFSKNRAAAIMSGSDTKSSININMCKCISKEGETLHMNKEKLPEVLDDMFKELPSLKDYEDDVKGNKAFRLEECLCNIAGKDPDVFMGVDSICVTYPGRNVRITIYRDKDLLEIYSGVTYGGRQIEVQYKSDVVLVMKEVLPLFSVDKVNYFLCIDCECRIRYGVTIPANLRVKTPIELNNNKLLTPLVVQKDGDISITGSVMIEALVPIVANGVDEVVIKGSGVLTLTSTGELQPCIGTITTTGMSYGRWASSGIPPKRIIIDGVVVNCKSLVDNFTLGRYGSNEVPEVILRNNGRILCPEAEGERVVTKQAKAPDGSTKISEKMEYAIIKNGMIPSDMINPQVKIYMDQLPPHIRKYVTYNTQPDNIIEAVRLYNMNNNLNPVIVLDGTKRVSYARTAVLLCNDDIYSNQEFELESKKLSYLATTFAERNKIESDGIDMNIEQIVCCLLIAVHDTLGTGIHRYDYEVLYEMIPAYFFDGWVKGNKKESVEKYIRENTGARKMIGRIRNHLKIAECIEKLHM